MAKTIDTLIADITKLIEEGHEPHDDNVAALGAAIAKTIKNRLKEAAAPPRPFTLRMSTLGRPDRQQWFDAHFKGQPEELRAPQRLKFLFGDILELMLIFLAKEAGHEVTDEQKEIEIDGIKGHMDCKIDGVVVDAKSCSTYSYDKFKDGSLIRKDDFGYMWQLSGYSWAEANSPGAFFFIDKTLGNFGLLQFTGDDLRLYNIPERITELKAVIQLPEPPEYCYDEVPDGKSGNMKLDTGCAYCKHKEECWPAIRTFIYSTGPRYLTKVVRVPDVLEIVKQKEPDNG